MKLRKLELNFSIFNYSLINSIKELQFHLLNFELGSDINDFSFEINLLRFTKLNLAGNYYKINFYEISYLDIAKYYGSEFSIVFGKDFFGLSIKLPFLRIKKSFSLKSINPNTKKILELLCL